MATEDEFYKAATKQLRTNSSEDVQELKQRLKEMSGNLSNIAKEADNLVKLISISPDLKNIQSVTKRIQENEDLKKSLEEQITKLQAQIDQRKKTTINITKLKIIYKEFKDIYPRLPNQLKTKVSKLLIEAIISHIKKRENGGKLEILLRGDGYVREVWDKIKDSYKSGKLSDMIAKSGENVKRRGSISRYRHNWSPNCSIDRTFTIVALFPQKPIKEANTQKPRLDYKKLANEYQQLIDNGTCANRADAARYYGSKPGLGDESYEIIESNLIKKQ